MRHKDVRECSIGAFAFYLYFRFLVSGEMENQCRPDFCNNHEWFDIKILSDGTHNNRKVMKASSYTGPLKKIYEELHVIAAHYGHFGRVAAPVKLEFEEVLPELIRILGKLLGEDEEGGGASLMVGGLTSVFKLPYKYC